MKRRDFLKNSALASSFLFVPGFVRAMEQDIFLSKGIKRLVIIQLAGGNDGLNTIVPFRNDIYYSERPSIALKPKSLLALNDELGFHKNLKELKDLYDSGELTIINNVGYPNPNRSHFRSSDIWHTASRSEEVLKNGWIGRYLDRYGSKPYNAIEIGNSLSVVLKGKHRSGVVTKDAGFLHKVASDPYFKKVLSHHDEQHLSEHNMGYLYQTMIDARQSAAYIHEKSKVFSSRFNYGKSAFGEQLKTISEFINSGLDTKVYYATLGGFDTHVKQEGAQDDLLKTYSEAVGTLTEDLKANNSFNDTLILTFSEFGRRVSQNAADGTDHGAANNLFLIGGRLKQPGMFNEAPDLLNLDENGDLIYTVDFRSIYANILENWLDADPAKILSSAVIPVSIV
jgi:uncharacterized protein (DUF1501 family)